jgi:hypothetical protein
VIVSINEGENEDDMISNPTPVGEGFVPSRTRYLLDIF